MIDHVTFELTSREALESDDLADFMDCVGFREVQPDDPFEHDYLVRWFKKTGTPLVHFVYAEDEEGDVNDVVLGLGHACFRLGAMEYEFATLSTFCVRESGSGRAWMEYGEARFEIRPV